MHVDQQAPGQQALGQQAFGRRALLRITGKAA